jgi:hypothetical protein
VVDAERGAAPENTGNDIVAQIAELGAVLRLCVGQQRDFEIPALLLASERKIDAGRQRTRGSNSGVAVGDMLRAALRVM